ncbi:coenzyme A transporter [Dispira simplex]|nr:coenzyme A transporter [Dispira simplex]
MAITPRDKRKNDPRYALKTLVAGGIAGCMAKTAVAPLDRVKILFQANQPHFQKYSGSVLGVFRASREIFSSRGVLGLYQGHSMTLLRIFPSSAIKFMSVEQYRMLLMPDPSMKSHTREFVAGALAGLTSAVSTYPLDLMRVRLAYDTSVISSGSRLWFTLQQIHAEPSYRKRWLKLPILNFYRGCGMTLLGMVPYAGSTFCTYSILTGLCRNTYPELTTVSPDVSPQVADREGNPKVFLKWWAELACGGLAGAMGQTVSYPIEVVRRRIQVAGALGRSAYSTPGPIIKEIYATKGIRGFFVGLSIGYIKVTPMFAIAFFVYEEMKQLLRID